MGGRSVFQQAGEVAWDGGGVLGIGFESGAE